MISNITCMMEDQHLLYLISIYTEHNQWLQADHLDVLIYEALPYSNSATPTLLHSDKLWMNISHHARSTLDTLLITATGATAPLVTRLKSTSPQGLTSVAYQISSQGKAQLQSISQQIMNSINDCVFPELPPRASGSRYDTRTNLLRVSFLPEQNKFRLSNMYIDRLSDITNLKKISFRSMSYCSSTTNGPITTACTTAAANPTSTSTSTLTCKPQASAILLESVSLIVTEWLPMGSNQLARLCDRLGVLERRWSNQLASEMTNVYIIDFDFAHYINFHATSWNNFGVHMSKSGTVMYGMKIDRCNNNELEDVLSSTQLSSIIALAHKDTALLTEDLLTPVQKSLLNAVNNGDWTHRAKYYVITAHDLQPFLPPKEFRSDVNVFNNSEIKQMIGVVFHIDSLPLNHILFRGRHGCLCAGHHSKSTDVHSLLNLFASLMGFDLHVQQYHKRITLMNIATRNVFHLLSAQKCVHSLHLHQAGTQVTNLQRDLILLETLMEYMSESLCLWKKRAFFAPITVNPSLSMLATALWNKLKFNSIHRTLRRRVQDMKKLIIGAGSKLQLLRNTATSKTKQHLMTSSNNIDKHFSTLARSTKMADKAAHSFKIMQLLFAGGLAFDVLDRATGAEMLGAKGVEIANCSVCWIYDIFPLEKPMLWWTLNIIWMILFVVGLEILMQQLRGQRKKESVKHALKNKKIDMRMLEKMLVEVTVVKTIVGENGITTVTFVTCMNKNVDGNQGLVAVELCYDAEKAVLKSVLISQKEGREWRTPSSPSLSSSSQAHLSGSLAVSFDHHVQKILDKISQ